MTWAVVSTIGYDTRGAIVLLRCTCGREAVRPIRNAHCERSCRGCMGARNRVREAVTPRVQPEGKPAERRRGPLRRVVGVDPSGVERLACGHVYPAPPVSVSSRPPRRRCPFCDPNPREAYNRARYEAARAARGAL